MTWWADYIGTPWVAGESDCWSFTRRVMSEQVGIELPVADVDACNSLACVRACDSEFSSRIRQNYAEAAKPYKDFDIVCMGRNKKVSHIGLWAGRGILHSVQGGGVIHTNPMVLSTIGLRILSVERRIA